VFPRASATFVPGPVRDVVAATGVDAALLARDAAEWVRRATSSLTSDRVADAARTFEDGLAESARRFLAVLGERLDARAKEKLERRVRELVQRAQDVASSAVEADSLAGAKQWPWLARATDAFDRGGQPQERFLSAAVPYVFHGTASCAAVDLVAAEHVAAALDGRVVHRVYSV
jgi:hypothetical protein